MDTRRKEHVGASRRVGVQPPNGFLQWIVVAHEEALGAGGQLDARAGLVDRGPRALDALDGHGKFVQRTGTVPVASSIESPATPVATHRLTFTATPSGLSE